MLIEEYYKIGLFEEIVKLRFNVKITNEDDAMTLK
jgi:hypothetical protein